MHWEGVRRDSARVVIAVASLAAVAVGASPALAGGPRVKPRALLLAPGDTQAYHARSTHTGRRQTIGHGIPGECRVRGMTGWARRDFGLLISRAWTFSSARWARCAMTTETALQRTDAGNPKLDTSGLGDEAFGIYSQVDNAYVVVWRRGRAVGELDVVVRRGPVPGRFPSDPPPATMLALAHGQDAHMAAALRAGGGGKPRGPTPYRAGQHLNFYASNEACTAAYVLELPTAAGREPVGMTAGHCSQYPAPGQPTENEGPVRVHGHDGGPKTDLGLNVVNLGHSGGPDALVFTLTGTPGLGLTQTIERSSRRPWTVTGWVPDAKQHKGLRVCFAGRTTGYDRCGRLTGTHHRSGRARLTCATQHSHAGDSGGPVYTRPSKRGTVRAVGIVTGAGLSGGLHPGRLCFTPIGSILSALHATFPRGPRVAPPVVGTPALATSAAGTAAGP